MPPEGDPTRPPVCDYEGSVYQASFWDQGGRQYEDAVEAIALKRLLPKSGNLLLEIGAGAGRNTPRYRGYDRIVLLDFSRTQLQQARARLGNSRRYIYVAADVYKMPFVAGLFDAATMIRACETPAPMVDRAAIRDWPDSRMGMGLTLTLPVFGARQAAASCQGKPTLSSVR
ncbi:MAG: class I SAM-dependent methyltransferase [Chloroflexi bacterium]|nr:class I SAM-dependent methyltransferase [Chloroflexota bacterium]